MDPRIALSAIALALAAPSGSIAAGTDLRREIAPTGTLRVGLAIAPSDGVLFVSQNPDGSLDGVTLDLGAHLAKALGLPVVFRVYQNTGKATDALKAGDIDVSFMPIDEARRKLIDFGPGYYDLESTYLVTDRSEAKDVEGVDRPGTRVVAVSGSTTLRASEASLHATKPEPLQTVAEGIERLRGGTADALALSRDQLVPILPKVPGSRIVSGAFQRTLIAVAVPKGRPEALASVGRWLDGAKADGTVRRAFDGHGLKDEPVAR